MTRTMTTLTVVGLVAAIVSLAGVVALGLSYENLRRQMAGIASDMTRVPNPSASHEHYEVRIAIIRLQLARVERPVIIMGDSLVEAAMLPASLCGHPVINAGVGTATIGFFTRYAEIILRDADPVLSVLAVGINDAGAGFDGQTFRQAYLSTLQSVRSPIAIATVVQAHHPAIDNSSVDRMNDEIRRLAADRSLIDLHAAVDGNFTTDGIHLNAEGYRLWEVALRHGIENRLGCTSSARANIPTR